MAESPFTSGTNATIFGVYFLSSCKQDNVSTVGNEMV